jgi:hypothetical protein
MFNSILRVTFVTCFRLYTTDSLLIINMDTGSVADVSKVHAASMFRVQVHTCTQNYSLQSWRWKQHVPLRCCQRSPHPHSVQTPLLLLPVWKAVTGFSVYWNLRCCCFMTLCRYIWSVQAWSCKFPCLPTDVWGLRPGPQNCVNMQ